MRMMLVDRLEFLDHRFSGTVVNDSSLSLDATSLRRKLSMRRETIKVVMLRGFMNDAWTAEKSNLLTGY